MNMDEHIIPRQGNRILCVCQVDGTFYYRHSLWHILQVIVHFDTKRTSFCLECENDILTYETRLIIAGRLANQLIHRSLSGRP